VTFHKSYSYEDFIAGIKAVSENGNISYRIEDGIFKEFCDIASKNRGQNYVFIIDEINRGDISRIFGELITLIEEDKREISINLPFKREGKAIDFSVPDNLYIIGTMNDSDRNIALIDVALRRRFTFFRVGFNEKLLEQWLKVLGDESSNKIKEFVKYLNEEIKTRMGEDYEIGHAFFAPIKEKDVKDAQDEVYTIFKYRIFPLLEEYFYSDREILTEFLKEFYEYDSSRKNENDRIPVIKAKEFKNFDELMSLIKNTLENRE
jgi:5-methylcytosine-specific restriction protein B